MLDILDLPNNYSRFNLETQIIQSVKLRENQLEIGIHTEIVFKNRPSVDIACWRNLIRTPDRWEGILSSINKKKHKKNFYWSRRILI